DRDDGTRERCSNGVSGGLIHKLTDPQASIDYSTGTWYLTMGDGTSGANAMTVTILGCDAAPPGR
ncbi:MAG: hypothetical protein MKZ56_04515, partial [Candidatus Thalassarchaeum sp.]|nr:hypothetical protein [Candidatus Thalassarchaeum sp.]